MFTDSYVAFRLLNHVIGLEQWGEGLDPIHTPPNLDPIFVYAIIRNDRFYEINTHTLQTMIELLPKTQEFITLELINGFTITFDKHRLTKVINILDYTKDEFVIFTYYKRDNNDEAQVTRAAYFKRNCDEAILLPIRRS